jgi:hypothetical protein
MRIQIAVLADPPTDQGRPRATGRSQGDGEARRCGLTASLPAGSSQSFSSNPIRHIIGFPRYRVRLYNTSDKTVSVNLFAYLTN